MKRVMIAVLVLVLALAAAGAAAERIEWHTYEAGMARGRAEAKKVFVHFYADWCTFCVEMERTTFKDPAVVAALNRHFITIRVDSDRHKEIAALFRVKGLPDSWFMDEAGAAIGHRPGFIPPEQFLAILKVIVDGVAGK
jgi:thioredoxin-related protein